MQEEAVLEMIRAMRHSAVNHLQVIAGWLQLGQADRAREYIAGVTERVAAEATLARLQSAPLALALLAPAVEAELHSVAMNWRVGPLTGHFPAPAVAEGLRTLLLAAVDELSGCKGDVAPSLDITVEAIRDGLRLQLQSSQALVLAAAGVQEGAAAFGIRLAGLGSTSLELQVPAAEHA